MIAANGKRMVIVGVTGAGALAVVNELAKGNVPSARIGVGVAISGAMLLVLAEFSPQLAGAFGALILVTSAFVTGATAWQAITRVTK